MQSFKKGIERDLIEILESIEVPESRYEKAIKSYKSIGEWLNREESTLKEYNPKIYSQGSFRFGTAIKPISENDEYDVDIVCELKLSKKKITQEQLKKMVGIEIDKYIKSKNMRNGIEEGKRCWTLNYSDEAKFHIDVLPCIPNGEEFTRFLESKSLKSDFSNISIDITDNTMNNYKKIDNRWNCSNPIGYHEWFKKQMEVMYEERRNILLENLQNYTVEDIPEYKIKTPLQKVIQLLKRHRDIMFEEDQDSKPISIIISTLAAKAYKNEHNLIDAYENVINNMENYLDKNDGVYWITNPVNPLENFADKWEIYPDRKESFFRWLRQVKLDYQNIMLNETNKIEKRDIYESIFGKSTKSTELPTVRNILDVDISHKQAPKWPLKIYGDVNIAAYKSRDGFRRNRFKSGELLMKKTKLRFEVETNIKYPYKTYWRVTNSGKEAREARCLRGDFYDEMIQKGKRIREETTSYKGVHTVECFIVKDGVCVGKSEPFIVNVY